MDPKTTRGYLNNNPGNVDRISGNPWKGEITDPADLRLTDFQRNELVNGRFCVFEDALHGIRCLALDLKA